MSSSEQSSRPSRRRGLGFTRRDVLTAGGAALIGLSLRDSVFASVLGQNVTFPGVTTVSGAKKPVFVPAPDSMDPVAHSLAESLFWLDQEFEHTKFFIMHMPSPDLDKERSQVMQFQNDFDARLKAVQGSGADRANLASFNRPTIELVRRFLDVKRQMEKEQEAGRLKSLAWPTFF
jgi:hypothetical protein